MIEYYKFTDKEKDELLKSMVYLVDTREKSNSHITDWFDRKGIKWKTRALKQGDYSFMIPANDKLGIPHDLDFSNKIIVERKGSLEELSTNLTKERDRLEKEFALAPEKKVLIIENADYGDIISGNYRSEYNAKSYWASIHSLWHKYNIPFMCMTSNKYTAPFIKGYFEYYLKDLIR